MTPSTFLVAAGSVVLDYSFAVADQGEGCFIAKADQVQAVYSTGGVRR